MVCDRDKIFENGTDLPDNGMVENERGNEERTLLIPGVFFRAGCGYSF